MQTSTAGIQSRFEIVTIFNTFQAECNPDISFVVVWIDEMSVYDGPVI